eukprot:6968106-Prymnesium_polylepis.2
MARGRHGATARGDGTGRRLGDGSGTARGRLGDGSGTARGRHGERVGALKVRGADESSRGPLGGRASVHVSGSAWHQAIHPRTGGGRSRAGPRARTVEVGEDGLQDVGEDGALVAAHHHHLELLEVGRRRAKLLEHKAALHE